MRLARSGIADQAGVEVLVDPLASRQFQHFLFAERRRGGKVVGVQVLEHAKARRLDAGREPGNDQAGLPQRVD